MKQIDWSEAPDWARQHGYAGPNSLEVWLDHEKYTYCDGSQNGMEFMFGSGICGRAHSEVINRTDRPDLKWSGEGMPPFGLDVEVLHAMYGWIGAKVVGADGSATIVRTNDGYAGVHPHEIRPTRTPEQIAEDLKNKAIAEMMTHVVWATPFDCDVLYRAGYRKVKPGK